MFLPRGCPFASLHTTCERTVSHDDDNEAMPLCTAAFRSLCDSHLLPEFSSSRESSGNQRKGSNCVCAPPPSVVPACMCVTCDIFHFQSSISKQSPTESCPPLSARLLAIRHAHASTLSLCMSYRGWRSTLTSLRQEDMYAGRAATPFYPSVRCACACVRACGACSGWGWGVNATAKRGRVRG